MRILHVIWGLGGGGKERRLIQLMKGLNTRGFDQCLVSFLDANDYKGSFEQYCNFLIVKGKNKIDRCIKFLQIIKKQKPDVVHLWSCNPLVSLIMPVLKLRYGFKYVAGFIADAVPVKRLSFLSIANHVTYLFANAIVSNSKAGLDAKRANYKKAHVIYNGFDFNRFKLSNFNRLDYKEKLGIKEKYVATMVARFTPSKDYEMFLELAKQFNDNNDVIFVAVGRGETMKDCINYCLDNGINNVKFLGFRSDVEEILMCSDFGILFTNENVHAEGVSNSIMESMAAGLPVIATDGGGTPEIIENRISGFIIPPKDYNEASKVLNELMQDELMRNKIGAAAKRRIETQFSLRTMTDEYIKLYSII